MELQLHQRMRPDYQSIWLRDLDGVLRTAFKSSSMSFCPVPDPPIKSDIYKFIHTHIFCMRQLHFHIRNKLYICHQCKTTFTMQDDLDVNDTPVTVLRDWSLIFSSDQLLEMRDVVVLHDAGHRVHYDNNNDQHFAYTFRYGKIRH